MKKPQTIIYDFDGTIINTLPWHLRAYRLAIEKFGRQASDDEIISKCFNIIDPVAAKNFGIKDAEAFSHYYRAGARTGFKRAGLHKNIIKTLGQLKRRGYTLCLGSLAREIDFRPALNRFGLKKYFDVIMSFDDCPREKPVIFKAIAVKARSNPSQVMVVGDAANDIEAAKKMNGRVALYHPPEHEKFYTKKSLKALRPDFIIEDHLGILNLLSGVD